MSSNIEILCSPDKKNTFCSCDSNMRDVVSSLCESARCVEQSVFSSYLTQYKVSGFRDRPADL